MPDAMFEFRFNGRSPKNEAGGGGPGPGDPCDTGTWDFTETCQSGHLLTVGFM